MSARQPAPAVDALFFASRYNARPKAPAKYLRARLIERGTKRRPAIIGMTEVYAQHKPHLRRLLIGLGYTVRFRDEYLIAWLPKVLKPRTDTPLVLRRMCELREGRDRWMDPDMLTARLTHIDTGTPVAVDVLHSPAGVEWGRSYRGGIQSKAHQETYAAWGRLIRSRRTGVVTIALHDSNVDHGRREWRARIEKALGLGGLWSVVTPVGTHRNPGTRKGRRCIDAIHASTPITTGGALDWPPLGRLDHRAVWATVTIPTKEKKR